MRSLQARLTGDERLRGIVDELHSATVLDFWQWAFSNLRANDTMSAEEFTQKAKILIQEAGIAKG